MDLRSTGKFPPRHLMAITGLNPLAAFGKDRQSTAALHIEEHGGVVRSEGEAVMAFNEYGNRAVYNWEKNGNLQ